MFALSCTLSAFCLCKVSTVTPKSSPQNTVVLLLCNFVQLKQRGYKAWWEHWLGLIVNLFKVWFKVYYVPVSAGNGWFLQQNITQDRKSFITQSKLMIFW